MRRGTVQQGQERRKGKVQQRRDAAVPGVVHGAVLEAGGASGQTIRIIQVHTNLSPW
jgi:hypothetical protein